MSFIGEVFTPHAPQNCLSELGCAGFIRFYDFLWVEFVLCGADIPLTPFAHAQLQQLETIDLFECVLKHVNMSLFCDS